MPVRDAVVIVQHESSTDPPELTAALIESITEAMVVADANGNLIRHNPASLILHGYESEEEALRGMDTVATVWEVEDLAGNPLPPEVWPLACALRGERYSGYEVRVRRTDTGKSFIGSYSGTTILDKSGRLQYALITIRDVTKEKEAEARMRERETQLRLSLEAAELGLWSNNLVTGETHWNSRTRQIFGVGADEAASIERGFELIHPEDRERAQEAFARATAPGSDGTYALEKRFVRPDGSIRWVETRAKVQFEGDRATQMIGVVEDVTAQKESKTLLEEQKRQLEAELAARRQVEKALKQSEERFRTLLMEAPVGITIYDNQRRTHYLNHAFTRMTGYSIDDIPTVDHWMQLAYRDRVEEINRTVGQLAHHDEPYEGELEIWTAWDELRTFHVTSVSLSHFHEGSRMRVSSFLDITDQKQAETALHELNRTLEERVEARTRALTKTSEALMEARNRFFTLFHSSPIPTHLTDMEDGTILDANIAYGDLFNLSHDEVVGRHTNELAMLMNAREEERERVRTLIETKGQAANVEMHLTNGQGEERVMLVSVEVAALDGRPVAVSTLIDVTERLKAERQVHDLAMALTHAEEQERRRLALLLHDDIQQTLIALHMQAQIGLNGEADQMREALQQIVDYSTETIERTRALSMDLSLPAFQSSRLQEGLEWIRNFVKDRYNLDVQLEVAEAAAIADPDVRTMVLRLVRELLFNVVKHAGINQALVQANVETGTLLIKVIDKGQGFDPTSLEQPSDSTGFGLVGMGDRLGLFGGRIEVDSSSGDGTCVTLHLPAA